MQTAAKTLRTDRMTLRQPQAGDLPVYTSYCASDRARFVRGPFSALEAFDKLSAMAGHWTLRGYGRYIMEAGGAPIGHVGPLCFDTAEPAELTWTLWDGTYEGQGLATEGALRVKEHLFEDLGWQQLTILVMPENHKSAAIAERLGAKLTDLPAPHWYPGCHTYRLSAEAA